MSKTESTGYGNASADVHRGPYQAPILPDEDNRRFWDGMARDLAGLFTAIQSGEREKWIEEHFLEDYPRDVEDESLISDFVVTRYVSEFMRIAYQLEHCGRLLLEELDDEKQVRPRSRAREKRPRPMRPSHR
jgi:hypothetical protein